MVQREVVSEKLTNALRRLDAAEERFGRSLEAFAADEEGRDLATFYIFLAVQECIDIAAHWVADAGWKSPHDLGGLFDVLSAKGRIPPDLAKGLRGAVGLRNRVAHNYGSVEPERLYEEFHTGAETLRRFLVIVAAEAGL